MSVTAPEGGLPAWIDTTSTVGVHPAYYRAGTIMNPITHNFFFTGGGLGDYITWSIAIRYIHTFHLHVRIKLFVPTYTLDLFTNIFSRMERVEVVPIEDFEKHLMEGSPILGNIHKNQLLNALGCHLIDNGFAYYANLCPAPEEADLTYPHIDTYKVDLRKFNLPEGPWAVMTPGATSPTRTMPPRHFNYLKDHLISRGLTPIFLGKSGLIGTYKASFQEDYNYEGGINLLEQTTLLEATKIIERSKLVVGLDNGLLHLAACTPTPIIFGHTVATPETRRPIRQRGLTLDITIPQEKLACVGCQVKFRFVPGHHFTSCLYKDFKCLELLFDGECVEWLRAIDFICPDP